MKPTIPHQVRRGGRTRGSAGGRGRGRIGGAGSCDHRFGAPGGFSARTSRSGRSRPESIPTTSAQGLKIEPTNMRWSRSRRRTARSTARARIAEVRVRVEQMVTSTSRSSTRQAVDDRYVVPASRAVSRLRRPGYASEIVGRRRRGGRPFERAAPHGLAPARPPRAADDDVDEKDSSETR